MLSNYLCNIDLSGRTAFDLACINGRKDIVE